MIARLSPLALLAAVVALLAAAPAASASSGSITNVHSVGGEVEATYSSNFDTCSEGYCGWYPHAWQYPASQPCAPNGSHLTYVGSFHSASGSETANDRFYPASSGQIRICLYGYQAGTDTFLAEALFTPTSSMSGSITNVHAISHGRVEATYTTSFDHCVEGYCGWYPLAWQYPSSQPCSPNGAHLTFVGDTHSSSGTETASDDFYPESGAVRICLYASQSDTKYFIAETVYFSGPAPNRSVRFTVGNQEVRFYYPKSCVTSGREIQLRVVPKTMKKSKAPKTSVKRVDFSLDQTKRTDKKKAWQVNFPTSAFAPGSSHKAGAKITFKQSGGKKIVKKLSKSFRMC